MVAKDEVQKWWTEALLGQQVSAHPVFGAKVKVDADGSVVTLTGDVETTTQAEELVAEAERMPNIDTVVNHLTVGSEGAPYHLQTVIGVFADSEAAQLACQTIASSKLHDERSADVIDSAAEAQRSLTTLAHQAGVDDIQEYVEAVKNGKVLLVDRVPEDDAFRVVSALEGTTAELVRTLPPEPEAATRT
jgi:osmotically-inducible protein OsmY